MAMRMLEILDKRQKDQIFSEVSKYKWPQTLGILVFYTEFFSLLLALAISGIEKSKYPFI